MKIGFGAFIDKWKIRSRDSDYLQVKIFQRRNVIVPIPYWQIKNLPDIEIISILIKKMNINDDPTKYC